MRRVSCIYMFTYIVQHVRAKKSQIKRLRFKIQSLYKLVLDRIYISLYKLSLGRTINFLIAITFYV